MKRESLKLQDADWFWLGQIADDTGSRYSGKASWRRLITRIARGDLVVITAAQKAEYEARAKVVPVAQPARLGELTSGAKGDAEFKEKFPRFAARVPFPFRSAF